MESAWAEPHLLLGAIYHVQKKDDLALEEHEILKGLDPHQAAELLRIIGE